VLAWRRGPSAPWALRPAISSVVAAVLLVLLVWFAAELIADGGLAGLAERIFGVVQGVWPLAVVLSCRRAAANRMPDTGQPATLPGLEPAVE
jgi:hypothetical protein